MPKTPQEIIEEFEANAYAELWDSDNAGIDAEKTSAFIRSSMLSLLEGVIEGLPKRDGDMFPGIFAFADGEEFARARQRGMGYGYDRAIFDCRAAIQSVIDSIKE